MAYNGYEERFSISFRRYAEHRFLHERMVNVRRWCMENLPITEYRIDDTDVGIAIFIFTPESAMAYILRWE